MLHRPDPTVPGTRFTRAASATLGLCLAVAGCGDSTGPGANVPFPTISAADAAAYCIRGQAVPPTTVSGSITATDCAGGGNTGSGYYDAYHVRVASSTIVTFTTETNVTFDSYLVLLRIGDVGDIANTSTVLASNDDGGPGLNAQITYVLNPDTDYFILVSGLDGSETGPYTIDMSDS